MNLTHTGLHRFFRRVCRYRKLAGLLIRRPRARDITILIDMIRKEAKENRGIDLKSEAQVIGDRDPQF